MGMHRFTSIVASLILAGMLLFPLSASAIVPLIPFGGAITQIFYCVNGGIYFTDVNPAGLGSGSFTWTPGSITYPYGPPHPASWILGQADIFYPCVISLYPFIALPSLRVTMEGTSISI